MNPAAGRKIWVCIIPHVVILYHLPRCDRPLASRRSSHLVAGVGSTPPLVPLNLQERSCFSRSGEDGASTQKASPRRKNLRAMKFRLNPLSARLTEGAGARVRSLRYIVDVGLPPRGKRTRAAGQNTRFLGGGAFCASRGHRRRRCGGRANSCLCASGNEHHCSRGPPVITRRDEAEQRVSPVDFESRTERRPD